MRSPTYINNISDFQSYIVLGETPENSVLDFKRDINGWPKANKKEQLEFALDVAQFANTFGGCLLIGIEEGRINKKKVAATVYELDDFDDRKEWLTQALRNYLIPHTIPYRIQLIEHDDGLIIAVNVEPFQHLVSVWDGSRNINYPYRTDFGKKYMNPDEAERHSMNSTRATQIALISAVKGTNQDNIPVELAPIVMNDPGPITASGTRWYPLKCQVTLDTRSLSKHEFKLHIIVSGREGVPVHVPYGLVREAWITENENVGLFLNACIVRRDDRFVLDLIRPL